MNLASNNDIQDFVDLPLSQRIALFKQISRIFDVGYALLPYFKNRTLTNADYYADSKTYSSSYFNIHSNLSPNTKQKKKNNKKSKSKKRNQSKHKNHQQNASVNQHNTSGGGGEYYTGRNQSLDKSSMHQSSKKAEITPTSRHRVYKKDPNINYSELTLLKIIKQSGDTYSVHLIMDLQRSIFELTREVTKNPMLHPELIASGMAWKAI